MATTLTCVTGAGTKHVVPTTGLLTAEVEDQVAEDTYRWIKSLRHVPYDGETFRDRFRYHGTSLWWFTELYLHKTRQLERAVRMLAMLDAVCRGHGPTGLEVQSSDPAEHLAARAFAAARKVPITMRGVPPEPANARWSSYRMGVAAQLSRLRPTVRRRTAARPLISAFVHTAFWRGSGAAHPSDESYIGPVLDAVADRMGADGLVCIGVGPRRNFRARRWWDPVVRGTPSALITPIERFAPRRTLVDSLDLWRRRGALAVEVVQNPGMREAAVVHGCDLWTLLERELRDAALLQWPWSARAMDEAGAALEALSPDAALTYAEAGGWGRALVAEARRRAIPTIGVQHGFIYRHWLNYRHEPDEIAVDAAGDAFPFPDRTLLFDGQAASHLREAGRLPADTLCVTGNPRLDVLVPRFVAMRRDDRTAARAELGASDGQQVVVLAAKFVEIQSQLRELFEAAQRLPHVRLVVKPHPAEVPDGYAALASGLDHVVIASGSHDLARLLAAADVLVTRNSTVAIDGLLLDLPALVVGLPNNLSPFVESGAMLGAAPGGIGAALESLLYDQTVRDAVRAGARVTVARAGMRADGHAAARAADVILELVGT